MGYDVWREEFPVVAETVFFNHVLGNPVILATLQSPRPLIPQEAKAFEAAIQQRLNDSSIRLLARCQVPVDVTATGRILYGKAHFGPPDPEAETVDAAIRRAVAELPDMFVTALDVVRGKDGFEARAEIAGPRLITPKEITAIEGKAAAVAGTSVHFAAWSRSDLMVTGKRYLPVEEYTRQGLMVGREAETEVPLSKGSLEEPVESGKTP